MAGNSFDARLARMSQSFKIFSDVPSYINHYNTIEIANKKFQSERPKKHIQTSDILSTKLFKKISRSIKARPVKIPGGFSQSKRLIFSMKSLKSIEDKKEKELFKEGRELYNRIKREKTLEPYSNIQTEEYFYNPALNQRYKNSPNINEDGELRPALAKSPERTIERREFHKQAPLIIVLLDL